MELSLNTSVKQTDVDNETICAEGFYFDNYNSSDHFCVPLCDYWLSFSRSLSVTVIIVIIKIVTIISLLYLVLMAFWLQRDTM